MLFAVEDSGIQRQLDIVYEELRELQLLNELLLVQPVLRTAAGDWLVRQEGWIRRRIAFLETLGSTAARLCNEAQADLYELTLQWKDME